MEFAHLHVHSHYSLLDGLIKIEDLIRHAKKMGVNALALTDHGNIYGAVEFFKNAKKEEIKPIIGIEFYVAKKNRFSRDPSIDNQRYHLTILVKNEQGYKNLNQLITKSYLEGFYYKPRIDKELIEKFHEGLICLSGCLSSELIKYLEKDDLENAIKTARYYQNIFQEDYYLEIQKHFPLEIQKKLFNLAQKLNIPLVATQDVHYLLKEDKEIHEILLSIQTKNKFQNEDRLTFKNGDTSFLSPQEMFENFKEIPSAIQNTLIIAEKCNFELKLNQNLLPSFPLPENETSAIDYLRKLTEKNFKNRYQENNERAKKQLEYELKIIEKTGFADYFLIVQDIINWAKNRNIIVGPGRGSAAGSIVSYILNITEIDPLKYGLIFERFLNPERVSMPDIDIDFADYRRDEVLAYARNKYGEDRVAQIITFGRMAARAAVRDVNRALNFPYNFGDKIAKLIPFNASIKDALNNIEELKKMYEEDQRVKKILEIAKKLEGTARHASIHACGVVIGPKSLLNYIPLQKTPADNNLVTQFEMHSIEDLGLLKIDFLGLRNLSIIEKTIQLIKETKNINVDIKNIPLNDQKTFETFQKGNTVGVFQFESKGMQKYLKELKPNNINDLIALIALYRPGPIESIPAYIRRKFKKEPIYYLHPKLKPILEETYGIGIFQEQMMRIATDLANFTLAEADTLRKAIGKKIKNLLEEQKEKLINGMIKNGIKEETALKIWELFPPFSRYGFVKAHATCYTIIAYQTAYLKTHFPVEFIATLLNLSAKDVDEINFLINEAKRLNIKVLPPDINLSFQNFTVDNDNIRFGLSAIKNIGLNIVNYIIEERLKNGPYQSISDFLSRIKHRDLNKKSLESLIKCGVFDSLKINRGVLLYNLDELLKYNQLIKKEVNNQFNLFGQKINHLNQLKLKAAPEVNKQTILNWEKELLGLYLTDHPFNAYSQKIQNKIPPIKESIKKNNNQNNLKIAGIVSNIQKITTKNGKPMLFVTLEDLSDKIEVLVFDETIKKYPLAWQENKALIVNGKLSFKDKEPKIICNEVKEI